MSKPGSLSDGLRFMRIRPGEYRSVSYAHGSRISYNYVISRRDGLWQVYIAHQFADKMELFGMAASLPEARSLAFSHFMSVRDSA